MTDFLFLQLKPRSASASEPRRGLSLSQQRVYPLILAAHLPRPFDLPYTRACAIFASRAVTRRGRKRVPAAITRFTAPVTTDDLPARMAL
jgi:hypothetical protein